MLVRGKRKTLLVNINKAEGDALTQHWRTFDICMYRLSSCQVTAPVFRRHADNCRVMPVYSKLCEIRFVVVIDQPWRINHVDMHTLSIVLTVLIVYVRMRKRSHALQEYEKQQQRDAD
jgi:hypothetical protein